MFIIEVIFDDITAGDIVRLRASMQILPRISVLRESDIGSGNRKPANTGGK